MTAARSTVHGALVIVAAVVAAGPAGSPDGVAAARPLPERQAFLSEALKRLRSDSSILQRFAYRRHVEERVRDAEGRVTERRTRTYEVRPLPHDPDGFRWVIERDGRPTAPDDIARQEAEYRHRLARALEPETDAERRRRLDREEDRRREEAANAEEAKRIFSAEVVGREPVAGVTAVVVTFTPRAEVTPRSRTGRLLKAVEGRAWFSERDYELVRVESEMVDTVSYGWGILARIHKGATATIERRQLPDGTWVPSRYELVGRGRVLLVRGVQRDVTVTLWDLREVAPEASAKEQEESAVRPSVARAAHLEEGWDRHWAQ